MSVGPRGRSAPASGSPPGDGSPGPRNRGAALIGALGLAAAGLAVIAPPASASTLAGTAAGRGISIGTAGTARDIASSRWRAVAQSQFASLTMGNEGKWDTTEPQRGRFDWAPADTIAQYAGEQGLRLRGHTLVWHQQLPAWVREDRTAAEQRQVLIDHVEAQTQHFAGRVAQWDVVNEPLDEDGTLRPSVWSDRLGESYIADAFRAAHGADPQARLYLNDYNVEGINAKSTGLYELVERLLQDGVPVHGVGLQAHLIRGQVPGDIAQNIRRFVDLGLDVEITELDVRIQLPATDQDLAGQADDYAAVASACVSVRGCTGITTWGIHDAESWVPGTFPGFGSALLFDDQWAAKPAYGAVVRALGGVPEIPSPPPVPGTRTVMSTGFEDGLDGWHARAGETVERTQDSARTGSSALLSSGRTATWQGATVPVTDLFTPGRLHHVSAWIRLGTGSGNARISMQRDLPEDTRYEGVSSNTAVTADGWTEVSGDYLPFAGYTALGLYIETADTQADLLVDDVVVTTEADPDPTPTPTGVPTPTPTVTPTPTDSPTPGGTCRVSTTLAGWGTGLVAGLTVTNTGTAALEGWELAFDLPPGQRIVSSWNALFSSASGSVVARNASHNASVPPNASVTLGWVADHASTPELPSAFTLNGATCAVVAG